MHPPGDANVCRKTLAPGKVCGQEMRKGREKRGGRKGDFFTIDRKCGVVENYKGAHVCIICGILFETRTNR
jgi:hypothetical protein